MDEAEVAIEIIEEQRRVRCHMSKQIDEILRAARQVVTAWDSQDELLAHELIHRLSGPVDRLADLLMDLELDTLAEGDTRSPDLSSY